MKISFRTFLAAVIVGAVALGMATFNVLAQDPVPNANVIHVGTTIYDLLIAYATVVGTIISALVGWVMWKVKEKTGVDIDWGHRDAIETFVKNQAGNFLNRFESLKGIDINVSNPIIAQLANEGLKRVPDALKHFNLGPEALAQRISDMVGRLTAPAAVAAQPSPQPASAPGAAAPRDTKV